MMPNKLRKCKNVSLSTFILILKTIFKILFTMIYIYYIEDTDVLRP